MNFDFSYIDIAFKNGKVITVNKDDDICEAVGIKHNKIVFVGSNKDLENIINEKTKVYDLKGKTLMPGMIDTHIHPFLIGLLGEDLEAPMISLFNNRARSVADITALIKQAVKIKKTRAWVSLWGYEPSNLKENRNPTIEELDEAAPENPVQCMEGSGHRCMYNSKALEYIGIFDAEDAKKYPEGEVEIKNGKLTGALFGHTSFLLWSKVNYSADNMKRAAMVGNDAFIAAGLTSIHDMGACDKPSYHALQKLCREREFKPRVYMALHSIYGKKFSKEDIDHFLSLGLQTGLGDEYFKIGSCKFMIDGGSSVPSCYTREPFSHEPSMLREKGWEREEVADYIKLINDAECQATAHAIGDGAIEFMVEGYEKAFTENPRPDLRHRIEHCTLTDKDLIDRMAKMNICPSVNAGTVARNGDNYMKFFGERNKYYAALKSMIDAGVKCSLQSDAPSGPFGLECLDGAVNRYDRVHNVQCDQTQAVSVLEGVRIATINGAYSSFEEDIKGSIEIGKLADMIVLSEDILSINKFDIYNLKVDMTMIDGEICYVRNEAKDMFL
ncbi:MAG: amidohydrolase [Lachnospiraceae bacterium]|nr:amidohydrolase [Lachnospiraceae bacterium]